MLSLVGADAGVLIAYKGVELLAASLPLFSIPHEATIHVNATVLFAVGSRCLPGFCSAVRRRGIFFGRI